MAEPTTKFKKGDIICRDTDKEAQLFVVKSGQVSIMVVRGKHQVELGKITQGQVIGEKLLIGPGPPTGVLYVAASEVEALAVPAAAAKTQTEGAPQMLKLILKSLSDRQTALLGHMKELLIDADQRPCPEEAVAHVYGSMFAYAKLRGKPHAETKALEVEWNAMKQFCQRMFLVPPTRLENAAKILKKCDLIDLHFIVVEDLKTKKMLEKNPNMNPEDLPRELHRVTFKELPAIETFFEFYQNMFYKSMNSDAFKVEEKLIQYIRQMVRLADTQFPADRAGIARVDLKILGEAVTAAIGTTSVDFFAMMEGKGLFAKRETTPAGTHVAFHVADFRDSMRNWSILRELDKWNEKGLVDMHDDKKAAGGATGDECSSCKTPLQGAHKFCPNCGTPRAATPKAA